MTCLVDPKRMIMVSPFYFICDFTKAYPLWILMGAFLATVKDVCEN